ncbi:MAG TPA: class I SAM-dependent methyltransferase, partial [Armatimonadota bacterium]|nr:class I SAM-dependent methyltransferase [Armatimonadota bacterium]
MHDHTHQAVSVREQVAAAVYYALNILWFPVTLLGYVLWIGKAYRVGRAAGVSTTAQSPLYARWAMHRLGVRHDEAAHRLLLRLPGISPLAVSLVADPMLLAHRLTGYVPKTFRYPFAGDIPLQAVVAARQAFFDTVVERNLAHLTQLVILGAGFDTRAYRLPGEARVRAFEVDLPKTQALKRTVLEQTGIDATGVTFVAANFEQDDWFARLVEAGFDPGRPALFLW